MATCSVFMRLDIFLFSMVAVLEVAVTAVELISFLYDILQQGNTLTML